MGVYAPGSASGGVASSLALGNPAAGGQFTATVPAGQSWQIHAVRARFVTSAVVATRIPELRIFDAAGNFLGQSPQPLAGIAASQAQPCIWIPGYPAPAQFGAPLAYNLAPTPWADGAIFGPGFQIASFVTAMDGGDQWQTPSLLLTIF